MGVTGFNYSEDQAEAFAEYAGSESCRECHQEAYDSWLGSDHQLAERLPTPELDAGAFEPAREYKHASQTSKILSTNGQYHVATRGLSGGEELFPVGRYLLAAVRAFSGIRRNAHASQM